MIPAVSTNKVDARRLGTTLPAKSRCISASATCAVTFFFPVVASPLLPATEGGGRTCWWGRRKAKEGKCDDLT